MRARHEVEQRLSPLLRGPLRPAGPGSTQERRASSPAHRRVGSTFWDRGAILGSMMSRCPPDSTERVQVRVAPEARPSPVLDVRDPERWGEPVVMR
jgi:hypothetical protein